MKLTIWNKVVQGLIASSSYSSILLGIILVRDKETLMQWWQYDKIDDIRNTTGIGLLPLQYSEELGAAWDNCFGEGDGISTCYNKDLIEEKYRQYADKYL